MSTPILWGPHLWKFIHILCRIDYNDINKNKILLRHISDAIPFNCICKISYSEDLYLIDNINNNKDLYLWSVNLHNKINLKLNKPHYIPTDIDFIILDENNKSWGDPLWKFIHNITKINWEKYLPEFIILDSNKYYLSKMLADLNSFINIIPDEESKIFYQTKLNELNNKSTDELIQRRALYNWTVDIHNEINQKLGKPIYIETE